MKGWWDVLYTQPEPGSSRHHGDRQTPCFASIMLDGSIGLRNTIKRVRAHCFSPEHCPAAKFDSQLM